MISDTLSYTVRIQALPDEVWNALVNPCVMKQWMGEPEMSLEITTSWEVGKPIQIKGFHHLPFENTGTVLYFEPNIRLCYNFLSSISRLANTLENHSVVEFHLANHQNETQLTVALSNFPNEVIFKHLEFYWRTSILLLKKLIEIHKDA